MSLSVFQEEGRVKAECSTRHGRVSVDDVTTALSSMGLDLQQVADEVNFRVEDEVGIEVDAPVFNWPAEWDRARIVRLYAPNCPDGVFTSSREALQLAVPKLPALFHRCTALERMILVDCLDSMTLKNVLKAPCLKAVFFLLHDKPVVWPTEFSRFQRGHMLSRLTFIDWHQFQAMHILRLLVIQGLSSVRRWSVWLTRGLYDPRLLQTIASFITPVGR
jgi:hypothetical protein